MEKINYWPDIDEDGESTQSVFAFFKTLSQQLSGKYGGKIKCSFEEIKYSSNDFWDVSSQLHLIFKKKEEPGLIEKNKQEAHVRQFREYKFLIFSDNYFFRVSDFKIGEYFPIEIKPADGIKNEAVNDYLTIYTEKDFEEEIISYIGSNYIKDVIRYIINSNENKKHS